MEIVMTLHRGDGLTETASVQTADDDAGAAYAQLKAVAASYLPKPEAAAEEPVEPLDVDVNAADEDVEE